MKSRFNIPLTFAFVLGFLSLLDSCRPKFYEAPATPAPAPGKANFSKYVAVGTTISAGFADNALFTEGQNAAYPNLIAQAILKANPALSFVQPDINSVNGWSGKNNFGRSLLQIPACTTVAITGVVQSGDGALLPYNGDKTKLTNLSVPFLPIKYINSPAGSIPSASTSTSPKPYYDHIVDPASAGIASEAKKRAGTFFTVWIGYEDALIFAKSGGTKPLPSTIEFISNLTALTDSLLAVPGASGIIANIPYVDQFPVITNNNRRLTSSTDPAKNPVKFDSTTAVKYNSALGSNLFTYNTGNKNYYAIQTGTGAVRQLTDPTKDPIKNNLDYIVRSNVLDSVGKGKIDPLAVRKCVADTNQRTLIGFTKPIANADVLDKDEIAALRVQIDAYNQAIADLVAARNAAGIKLAIVDLKTFYAKLTDPIYGIPYGSDIVRANHSSLGPDFGGFYSLDRYTPTPKGQSILANEFIKVINSAFAASLPFYNPGDFRGNEIH